MRTVTTPKEFQKWLNNAKSGARVAYHVGFLLLDREVRTTRDDGFTETAPREPIDSLARTVWDAYVSGHVALTQERLGPSQFVYIAEVV